MMPVTFINAGGSGGSPGALRIVGARIAALDVAPRAGDTVVDLNGDRLLPGLINAHDHLQLNSLPRIEFRKRYRHVRDWIADVDARRQTDRTFQAGIAVPRAARLLAGGVKNLLSGVTTVAHHDPLYPFLSEGGYPIRVIEDYGWSHSLYIDGERQVRDSYRSTAPDRPWIVHAAEGVDDEAAREFERLDALGCLGPNTLIVHGIALDQAQRRRLASARAGLVWCPSSNLRLFGRTASIGDLVGTGRVALGTDSRLSGARDLLAELKVARRIAGLDEPVLESLVTTAAARLLRLPDRGTLAPGALADVLVLPAGIPLSKAGRADVRMVMVNGTMRYGDGRYAQALAPARDWARVRVDGRSKVLDTAMVAPLLRLNVQESGLELPASRGKAA